MQCKTCGTEYDGNLPLCPNCGMTSPEHRPMPGVIIDPLQNSAAQASDQIQQPENIIGHSSPVGQHNLSVQEAKQAASQGLHNFTEAAKNTAASAGTNIHQFAERAKNSETVAKMSAQAKDFAGEAREFSGKAAAEVRQATNKAVTVLHKSSVFENKPLICMAAIMLVLLIIFGIVTDEAASAFALLIASLLIAALSSIFTMMYSEKYKPHGSQNAYINDQMQLVSAEGRVYIRNDVGMIYRMKNGSEQIENIEVYDSSSIFAGKGYLFICTSNGALLRIRHDHVQPETVLAPGTISGNKAVLASDGYIYFSSAKVSGNPACRIKCNSNAVQIITD